MIKKVLTLFCIFCFFAVSGAERVVSLSPALTQMIFYLGGQSNLCGRSSACFHPGTAGIPVAGDLGKPFPETVLHNRATVVISDIIHPDANWEILRRCGVKVELLDTSEISSLPANLRKLGRIIGVNAEKQAAGVEQKLEYLQKSIPEKRLQAAVFFSTSPLVSCGKDSFVSDALALAGIENIAADAGRGYFIISAEYVYSKNPDLIIIAGLPRSFAGASLQQGLLKNLSAVKQERIIFLESDAWLCLSPEIVDAIEQLRRETEKFR